MNYQATPETKAIARMSRDEALARKAELQAQYAAHQATCARCRPFRVNVDQPGPWVVPAECAKGYPIARALVHVRYRLDELAR